MLLAGATQTWGAVIIDFEPVYSANTDRLVFAKPVDNGIREMSSDYLTFEFRPPYYGDTINLKFWRLLGVDIGSPSGIAPLTRIDGYRYIYNHSTGKFFAYDDNDVLIAYAENVDSIGDMNIDFTVLRSHQMEIIFDVEDGGIKFIFPALWLRTKCPITMGEPIANGVNNIYLQDRVRPYKSTDVDNPSNEIKHVGAIDNVIVRENITDVVGNKIDLPKIGAVGYAWDINWDKNRPNNDFGRDGFDVNALKLRLDKLRGVKEEWDWILPILSTNMYPMLLPILRPGEVHINRPVYEPWLVMDIPIRESLIDYDNPFDPDPWNPDPDNPIPHNPPVITDDPEDEKFVIPVFDLSPRFQ